MCENRTKITPRVAYTSCDLPRQSVRISRPNSTGRFTISIRVGEKSAIGKRILLGSYSPWRLRKCSPAKRWWVNAPVWSREGVHRTVPRWFLILTCLLNRFHLSILHQFLLPGLTKKKGVGRGGKGTVKTCRACARNGYHGVQNTSMHRQECAFAKMEKQKPKD